MKRKKKKIVDEKYVFVLNDSKYFFLFLQWTARTRTALDMASVCLEHVSAGQIIYLYLQVRYPEIYIWLKHEPMFNNNNIYFLKQEKICFVFPFLTEVDLRKGWRGTNCDQVDDDEKQVNPDSLN